MVLMILLGLRNLPNSTRYPLQRVRGFQLEIAHRSKVLMCLLTQTDLLWQLMKFSGTSFAKTKMFGQLLLPRFALLQSCQTLNVSKLVFKWPQTVLWNCNGSLRSQFQRFLESPFPQTNNALNSPLVSCFWWPLQSKVLLSSHWEQSFCFHRRDILLLFYLK